MDSGIAERERQHSTESFDRCLRTWMKETSRSIATLAAELELKSPTTVARILQGESTSKACEKFCETLLGHVDVEEEWKDRFADALRAGRIGLQQCALFEVLIRQLRQPRSNNAILRSGDNSSILLILGCPWRQTFDYILHCLAQEADIRIYHYITSRELYDRPPVLEGLLTFLTETRYEAYLISDENLFGCEISWNMMIRINPDDMEEEIAVKESDNFSWLRLSQSQKLYLNCKEKLERLTPRLLYQNGNIKNGSDYIRLQKESWRMEDKHSKILLKPTPGIQMLPADLVVRSFTDFLNDNLEPISASANSNIYYFRKRAERFYSCETRLILSRQAMAAFARTGKLPDQFFACRPFDQRERLEILQYLLECMDRPQVSILFEQSNLSKDLTFEAYGRYGTLIYPSQTSYNVENDAYRELILPGTAWADLFYQFVEEVVIPDYCCSTLETRRLIIHLISELQSYHTGR